MNAIGGKREERRQRGDRGETQITSRWSGLWRVAGELTNTVAAAYLSRYAEKASFEHLDENISQWRSLIDSCIVLLKLASYWVW